MDAETAIRNLHMEGYNEGADDWYRKAWDDVGDTLEQAIEEKWPIQDLIDTLAADVRKYARRVVNASQPKGEV